MKKVLLLVSCMLVVVGLASTASAQRSTTTTTIYITPTGFSPESVKVRPGDTVVWKNTDKTNHQVVSDTGVFKSPIIKPGATYSYVFNVESSYSYHGGINKTWTGDVNVLVSRVSVGVTRIRLVYGNSVRIFGSIPSGAAGEQIVLHIASYGHPETTQVVTTQDGGVYEYKYSPKIRTGVYATWNGTTSMRTPFIGVRPLVIFRPLNLRTNLFFVKVKAERSYAHNIVRIQRQNHRGLWVTTTRVRLNAKGQARFTGKFARGRTKAQAIVSRHPGYAPGFSVIKFISR